MNTSYSNGRCDFLGRCKSAEHSRWAWLHINTLASRADGFLALVVTEAFWLGHTI